MIREPQQGPNEKKICMAASAHTYVTRSKNSFKKEPLQKRQFFHLHICETVKPGSDIVENAGHSSVKGEAKAEKDGEDDVGEDGGEVDRLPQALHTLDQGQEDDEPGENEAAGQLWTDSPNLRESEKCSERWIFYKHYLINARREFKHLP